MKTKWNKARKKTRYIMAANGILLLVFLALLGAMYLTRDSRLDGLGQREKLPGKGREQPKGRAKTGRERKSLPKRKGSSQIPATGNP